MPYSGPGIFVFTASERAARAHLRDTIEAPVPLERALTTFPRDAHEQLGQIASEHVGLYAWGAIPGPKNRSTWQSMNPADWAVCMYEKTYHYVAKVVAKFQNERFA